MFVPCVFRTQSVCACVCVCARACDLIRMWLCVCLSCAMVEFVGVYYITIAIFHNRLSERVCVCVCV
jgi:hypothetical protein